MGGEEETWVPFFSYALLPPIHPILPFLPVLALKRSRAMLRCQIKRLNKTDPNEPYRHIVAFRGNRQFSPYCHEICRGNRQFQPTRHDICRGNRFNHS
jgi:hypothetical protein